MLCSPRLSDNPPHPDTPPGHVSWRDDDLELSCFSGDSEGSAVMDLTLPQPKKNEEAYRLLCASNNKANKNAVYFLQRYKPLEPVTKAREDGTGGGLNRESPDAILGPSSSHDNQHDQWAF